MQREITLIKPMRLPSLSNLIGETRRTFTKFPLAITSGIIIAIAGIILADYNYLFEHKLTPEDRTILWHVILTLIFAVPIFASIQLASDKNQLKITTTILLKFMAIALAVLFYFLVLPSAKKIEMYDWLGQQATTTWILISSAFLLLTFLPFLKKDTSLNFWKYNKDLVKNFALTFFFAVVLFGGIALIIFSLDNLFEVKIEEELYLQFWIAIAAVFSPWVFLANFSRNLKNLDRPSKLSKMIKGFGQFILLPLLSVYTAILYVYTGKVLITQEWPEGLIGGLVIGYAIAAMVAHIILYPFEKENPWITKTKKAFYILLLPLTAMLFASIYLRVAEYGITESRYYVILLGLWLIGIALYFIFSKNQKIKYIPLTVFILLVLSLFGPWSAFNISENDQFRRLEKILTDNKILENGQVAKKYIADTDTSYEIQSIITYLIREHGTEKLEPLIADRLPKDFEEKKSWDREGIVQEIFGVNTYYNHYGATKDYYFSGPSSNFTNVLGYDYLLYVDSGSKSSNDGNIFNVSDNQTIKVYVNLTDKTVTVLNNNINLATLDLIAFINNLVAKYPSGYSQYPGAEEMTIVEENEKVKLIFAVSNFNINEKDEKLELINIRGHMLVKIK